MKTKKKYKNKQKIMENKNQTNNKINRINNKIELTLGEMQNKIKANAQDKYKYN